MSLIPDYTLLIQIFNFLLLLMILNSILFRPIRGILARRNEEFRSLEVAIGDYQDKCSQKEAGIEESRVQARKEGYSEREALKREGSEAEQHVLDEANVSAEARIQEVKAEIDQETRDVRAALENQITAFSAELTQKILGRSL
jgi:F-type H+-transporting ATPase subunit b